MRKNAMINLVEALLHCMQENKANIINQIKSK
jgi:hypothetical protein